MKQSPLLTVENLSHCYGNNHFGIKDISFSIHPGDFILVAGTNGSGKSTLFRHLNGLQSPTSGRVLLHGRPLAEQPQTALARVGLIFQDADTQIVGETVWDDVIFGPCNLKLPLDQVYDHGRRALKAMHLMHLKERDPATLSGGEKRKLAIAGVLAMTPEILVFDEPFSNLDAPGTLDLIAAIVSLHNSGHTIVLATHDIEKVFFYATRMLILSRGTLARQGSPETLLKDLESLGIREPCASRLGLAVPPWDQTCREISVNTTAAPDSTVPHDSTPCTFQPSAPDPSGGDHPQSPSPEKTAPLSGSTMQKENFGEKLKI